jgi:hypothetical protein
MKVKRHIFPDLKAVFESISEYQNMGDDLYDIPEDVNYKSILLNMPQ